MKLSLSEISTVGATFEEDVAAYSAAGFEGIGIWEFKLPEDDEANLKLLREAGLSVANCIPEVPSLLPLRLPGMEGPPDPEQRVEALRALQHRQVAGALEELQPRARDQAVVPERTLDRDDLVIQSPDDHRRYFDFR